MRLILDSHILLAITLKRSNRIEPGITRLMSGKEVRLWASAASLWEIAIKTRPGKLDPGLPLKDLPSFLEAVGIRIMPVTAAHALTLVEPMPPTRDPFDRMLLAQCHVERCRLVTADRALIGRPLAARVEAPSSGKPTPRNPRTRR